MTSFETITLQSIEICCLPELDGGGSTFGVDYIHFFEAHNIKVNRVFEWCCGPAYIGFTLLNYGLCNSLCLADINPIAVEACQETIRRNGIENKVSVYLSDNLEHIPLCETWDLVVGNPPHCGINRWDEHKGSSLIWNDNEWAIHDKFYSNISKFLKPGGMILIQENNKVSSIGNFRKMIEKGGLKLVEWTYQSSIYPDIYYVWSWKPKYYLWSWETA